MPTWVRGSDIRPPEDGRTDRDAAGAATRQPGSGSLPAKAAGKRGAKRRRSSAVRAARPPRPVHDPWRPQGVTVELERCPEGGFSPSATVFLTGAECPFTCVFCDLWRYTIDGPTPSGALPAQLSAALEQLPGLLREAGLDRCDQLKLYNASNFFDRQAVPEEDLEPIARLTGGFRRVVVECHPRLVDERVRRFADQLSGRLEVAMGLETAHPEALSRLGKQLTLERFDRAAERLRADGVDLRVFVLVGVPFVPAAEQAQRVSESVRHAARAGARSVALIPVRSGNGELERLETLGQFKPPDLALLEKCLAGALRVAVSRRRVAPGPEDPGHLPPVAVQVDPWDLDQVASDCEACRDERVAAIREMNRTGMPRRTVCGDCGL